MMVGAIPFLLLLLLALQEVSSFVGGAGRAYYLPSLRLQSIAEGDNFLPAQLVLDLRSYLAKRGNLEQQLEEEGNDQTSSSNNNKLFVPVSQWKSRTPVGKQKRTEPLEIAKASGWFKDEFEIDLKSRSDINVPLVVHPLSYVELEKLGYGRLSDEIVKFGGPYEVGRLMEIDWVEPEIELEPEPESARPRREQNFMLDIKGELSLGGTLEDKLSAAESIDMTALKATVERQRMASAGGGLASSSVSSDPNYPRGQGQRAGAGSGRLDESMQADAEQQDKERFALDSSQRLFLVVTLASFSVAWGRASDDLVSHHYLGSSGIDAALVEGAKVLSLATAASAVFSAAACAYFSQKQPQSQSGAAPPLNPLLWATMGLLGGPLTVASVRRRREGML